MLKRKWWLIGGIIFASIAGVLLHFVYQWSGENQIVGYFSVVNESTWEHLKLLFVPVATFSVFEWFKFRKDYPGFLMSRAIALILGMLWIIVSFYTISGIVGKADMPVINIGIFISGVIITFILTDIIMRSMFNPPDRANIIALVILLILAVLFAVWTYNPPSIGLFAVPQ